VGERRTFPRAHSARARIAPRKHSEIGLLHGARNIVEMGNKEGKGDGFNGVRFDLEAESTGAGGDRNEGPASENRLQPVDSLARIKVGWFFQGRGIGGRALGRLACWRSGIGECVQIRGDGAGAIHTQKDLVFSGTGNIPRDAHDILKVRVRDGFCGERVDDRKGFERSGKSVGVDLHSGNNFAELTHDFNLVGILDTGVGVGVGTDDDFEEKFVAGSVGKAGIVAVQVSCAHCSRASLAPLKDDALPSG